MWCAYFVLNPCKVFNNYTLHRTYFHYKNKVNLLSHKHECCRFRELLLNYVKLATHAYKSMTNKLTIENVCIYVHTWKHLNFASTLCNNINSTKKNMQVIRACVHAKKNHYTSNYTNESLWRGEYYFQQQNWCM